MRQPSRPSADTTKADICRYVIDMIQTGHWPPGSKIPTREELSGRFQCSLPTVNRAFNELKELNLLVRRGAAGTFVAEENGASSVLKIPDIAADVAGARKTYSYELKSRRVDNSGADGLDGRHLRIECLHLADRRPYAHELRLISLVSVPDAEHADFTSKSPGKWLLENVSWDRGVHRITAVALNGKLVKELKLKKSTACLVVRRATWKKDKQITLVTLTYLSPNMELIADFKP